MLVYVDSSVLARAYLPDEVGHERAKELVYEAEHLLVSATWTTVEVTSAVTRAAKVGRGDLDTLLGMLTEDTGDDGPITLLRADQAEIESQATSIVYEHALRSLDALHLAVANVAARPLVEPGQRLGIATRDEGQRAAARALGLVCI